MNLAREVNSNGSSRTSLGTKRRDGTRVIYDILLLSIEGASKTRIVRQANLNFPIAERYIRFLLAKDLLTKRSSAKNMVLYFLTEKGERLLPFLRAIEKELVEVQPTSRSKAPNSLSIMADLTEAR